MAANLARTTDGRIAMAAWGRIPVWHGKGQRSDDLMTVEQAHALGGTDYPVECFPSLYRSADGTIREGAGVQIVRPDTWAVLGQASQEYQIIPNKQAFGFFDQFIGKGLAGIMTAGVLGLGQKAWMQAVVGEIGVSEIDRATTTLLIATDHTAGGALKIGFNSTWVVCANTERFAQMEWDRTGNLMSVFHCHNVDEQLKRIAKAIDVAKGSFDKWQEKAILFANTTLDNVVQETRRLAIAAMPPHEETLKRWLSGDFHGSRHWVKAYGEITDELRKQPGAELETRRGTAWGALNAITGWIDFTRGGDRRRADTRIKSAWFGSGNDVKDRAFRHASRRWLDNKPWSEETLAIESMLERVAVAVN